MNCVKDILSRVGEVQPLPGTVLRLIQVVNNPNSTVEQMVEAVRYDQAVTSQMLRIVNSAYFSFSREISSLNEALRVLGSLKVLQLVMAIHTNSLLAKDQRGYGLSPGKLWQHSVGVALASAALADHLRQPNKNLLFTAGLLHDIGKVILNEYVAEEFADIVTQVGEKKISFSEAEKLALGFSHDEIGAQVAEKWQLPDTIVRGIRYHHDPGAADPPDVLVDILHLADCTCLMLGIGIGSDGLFYRADEEVMTRRGLRESDLEAIGAQVLVELKRVQSMFEEGNPSKSGEQAASRQEN
jgi:putative nucleotidyltransferase with HDIG domain